MTGDVLPQLALRFVNGDSIDIAGAETERDDTGAAFAMHVWCDPTAVDLTPLGTPTRLARLTPDQPTQLQFLPRNGLVVVELADDRVVAMHVYRFGTSSLAGAITTEDHVLALLEFVAGSGFTLDAAQQYFGAKKSADWLVDLEPRPGSNLERAGIELSEGTPHGLQLSLAQPIVLDFAVLRARFGEERTHISGNPPSFRRSYAFDGPGAYVLLATHEREDRSSTRRTIEDIVVRRRESNTASVKTTKPRGRAVTPSPLGPDRIVALVDALFERGIDEAAAHAMLGEPGAPVGGRRRLVPHDPDLAGVVTCFAGDRATVEIELATTAALDPKLLEPHLGTSRTVLPIHANASAAQRFHVRGATHAGYVLVAPERVTLHRMARDAWLGDFVRSEDFVTFVRRFVHGMQPDAFFGLVGDPGETTDFDNGDRMLKLIPFAGGNVASASIYFRRTQPIVTRIELTLHASRAIDCDLIALPGSFTGPRQSLLSMGINQYEASVRGHLVLLNTDDQRPGPVRMVRSTIIYKA